MRLQLLSIFIFHDKSEHKDVDEYSYRPFFPNGSSAGKHKISAVFMDSESHLKQLISNIQEPKLPLKII